MRIWALLLLLLAPLAAVAQETIVADLSQRRVSITTNFTGSEILIFGAVKREGARPSFEPLDVIITIAGPAEPVVVRRKDRRAGIWINVEEVEVDSAPSFYAILTSAPIDNILAATEDLRHKITKARVIRSVDGGDVEEAEAFTEALIRIRTEEDAYQLKEEHVILFDETLFRTSVSLPANLTEGAYKTTIYLVREKEVVSKYETAIQVRKVGLERFLYSLAHEQPLVYGLMSLAIAIFAGWAASAAFRLIKA